MGTVDYDFSGETAIVTGGSSGIGRAVARRFGGAGASVIVADVREEPKDADAPTHEAIRADGGEAEFAECDVSDPDQIESVVAAAREFGGVDVMVNNAGVHVPGLFLEADPADLDDLYGVNVRGTFVGCQAAARDMLERGDPGAIVNTASISSAFAQVGQSQYNATKAAVKLLTQNAALELAEAGVRVNAVAPGPIDTAIGDRSDRDRELPDGYERPTLQKPAPMGRSAPPEEIAGLYLALASDDASFVTGTLLYADGGFQAY